MNRDKIGAAAALAQLPTWRAVDGRDAITKRFVFRDFKAAFGFIVQVALKAEQMDHHPEWSNVYATVDILLATHDAGGVTGLDLALALFCDETAR